MKLYCSLCGKQIRYKLLNHVRLYHKGEYNKMAGTTSRVRRARLQILNGELDTSKYWNPRKV